MFNLKHPCKNCPFRRGQGECFRLSRLRLREIIKGVAFQCHKTVDYSEDEPSSGDKPQQCAGLMALLHREGKPNQIIQVAERLGHLDPSSIDPKEQAYSSIDEMYRAHGVK